MPFKQPDSSSGRHRIDLRLQAKYNTVDWEVYTYLMRNPNWSPKQGRAMLSQAVQDYWLADARQSIDPALAKTTALACIGRMEYQIAKLRRDFQLESSPAPSSLDRVNLEATIPALLELLGEVKRIPLSLEAISTALTKGSKAIPPALTVLTNGHSPDSSVPLALLTQPETVAPETVAPETERSYTNQDLDDFCRENSLLLENLAEDLG